MIKKEQILQGADQIEEVYIEELGQKIPIRPLTEGQWAQVKSAKNRGLKMRGSPHFDGAGNPDYTKTDFEMDLNLQEMDQGSSEADRTAVFYGVVIDGGWTMEDVARIKPPGAVRKLAKEIYRISGVEMEAQEAAEFFRGIRGGAGDSPSAPHGNASGAKTEGPDANTDDVSAKSTTKGNTGNARANRNGTGAQPNQTKQQTKKN